MSKEDMLAVMIISKKQYGYDDLFDILCGEERTNGRIGLSYGRNLYITTYPIPQKKIIGEAE